jgi:hypothetical protein
MQHQGRTIMDELRSVVCPRQRHGGFLLFGDNDEAETKNFVANPKKVVL